MRLKRLLLPHRQLTDYHFNSTVVRLKHAVMAGQTILYHNFNSTVVRLKPGYSYAKLYELRVFQFYCSAIKTFAFSSADNSTSSFQFYCSAIKTINFYTRSAKYSVISILL